MARAAFLILWLLLGGTAQGFASLDRPIAVDVVLVHGFLNDGRIFEPLCDRLQKEGCRCFAPSMRPRDGSTGVRDLASKLSGQIDAHFGKTAPIILIGFTMGGLVVRDYVQNLAGRRRIRAVFLISTGSGGTLWARFSPNPHVREMAPGSAFLTALNRNAAAWQTVPVHSYWTPLDLMIVPSVNTRWPAGQTTRILCLLHPWMVRDHRVITDIVARIRALRSCCSSSPKRGILRGA